MRADRRPRQDHDETVDDSDLDMYSEATSNPSVNALKDASEKPFAELPFRICTGQLEPF